MKNSEHPSLSLSLTVKNAADALDFYTRAFGAEELFRMPMPDGSVAHAEFMIGSTRLYISGESPEWHAHAMPAEGTAPCLFALAVENSDAAFKKAVDAGGQPLREPEDHFWGLRSGMIRDPFGYRWSLGHVTEEVSPEEMIKRAKELFGG